MLQKSAPLLPSQQGPIRLDEAKTQLMVTHITPSSIGRSDDRLGSRHSDTKLLWEQVVLLSLEDTFHFIQRVMTVTIFSVM